MFLKMAERNMKKHHCPVCMTSNHWFSGCEIAKRSLDPDLVKIYEDLEQKKKETLEEVRARMSEVGASFGSMPETDVAPVATQVGGRAKPAVSASDAASVLGKVSFFNSIAKGSTFEFGMYLKTSTSSDILIQLGLAILFIAAIVRAAKVIWHRYGRTQKTTRRGEANDGRRFFDGVERVLCVDCMKHNRPEKVWVRIGSLCSH